MSGTSGQLGVRNCSAPVKHGVKGQSRSKGHSYLGHSKSLISSTEVIVIDQLLHPLTVTAPHKH